MESLLNSINNINKEYLDNLPCICEKSMDNMKRSWICERHGFREPNYFAIWAAEERERIDKLADMAEFKREQERDDAAIRELEAEIRGERRGKRHPGDFDVYPSDEQKEYFKRGGR